MSSHLARLTKPFAARRVRMTATVHEGQECMDQIRAQIYKPPMGMEMCMHDRTSTHTERRACGEHSKQKHFLGDPPHPRPPSFEKEKRANFDEPPAQLGIQSKLAQ